MKYVTKYFYIGKVFITIIFIISASVCFGQKEIKYDEVTIYINAEGVGEFEAQGLIKSDVSYLSISEVFSLFKIKNIQSTNLDSLTGYFINQKEVYIIDNVNNQIVFQGKKIVLKPEDLILTETSLFMKTNLFGEVFGLNCKFNFRDLSVNMTTKLELPIIREMKIIQMRENLNRLTGNVRTDTTIGRSYPLFKFGMADWAVVTSKEQGLNSNTQLNFSLGSVIAGGELNLGINYNQAIRFNSQQQSYLWRYANNDHQALRQVLIGKIMPQTISLLNGSLVGIQLTNTPTTFRSSFGTYTITNVTEPDWMVELYINNVLVNFVKADASGFYKFEVPLVYGNTVLMFRMYGPWGEVRTKVMSANVPYNFVPAGELEYTINAGTIEGQPNSRFYRANVNYGLSKTISVIGGYEYYSASKVENSIPFIGSSIMLSKSLLIGGEYTLGVQSKGSLSYRLASDLQLDLNITQYEKGQKANLLAPIQERAISLSLPIQSKHFSSYSRITLSQSTFSDYKTTNAEFLFSGNISGVSSNITTTAMYYDPKHISAYSVFSLSLRLPGQLSIMPSIQYDYNQNKTTLMRCNLEKMLFGNGYLNIAFEKNSIDKMGTFEFGFRYNFSFMQASLNSILRKNSNSFSQSARGSILYDSKNMHIIGSNTYSVGRGGITILAYLDLNGNGKRDKNEPKVSGLNLRVNGGRVMKSIKDSTIRIIDLIPYTTYLVELDKNSFENITWRIKKLTMSVSADPNQFKTIEIPVDVMAEASGTVNVTSKTGTKGIGRVYVNFYRNNGTLVGRTLTEGDGYFTFMGLKPGQYTAMMDSNQLSKIKMKWSPAFKVFTVKPSMDGEFVEGINFTLQSKIKDSVNEVLNKIESNTETSKNKDTIIEKNISFNNKYVVPTSFNDLQKMNPIKSPIINDKPIIKDSNNFMQQKPALIQTTHSSLILKKQQYSIQYVVNFSVPQILTSLHQITATTIQPVILISDHESYKLMILGFSSRSDAEVVVKQLTDMGFEGCKIFDSPESKVIVDKNKKYSIQVGAYNFDINAIRAQQKISVITGLPVVFITDKGFYKLMMVGFSSKTEADLFVKKLSGMGIKSYVNKYTLTF